MQELDMLLARLLVESGALRLGRFLLTSGRESPIYIDMRSLLQNPRGYRLVTAGLYTMLEHCFNHFQGCVAGVATGGIAWAALLASYAGLAMGYVRPRRKEHGTGRQVEGCPPGSSVVIVDDVATTGGSLYNSAQVLAAEGYPVAGALVIVDRQQGAAERLRELGIPLCSVTTLRRLLEAAASQGLLDGEKVKEVLRQLYGGG